MTRIAVLLLGVATAGLGVTAASAGQVPSGPYVGVNVGYSLEKMNTSTGVADAVAVPPGVCAPPFFYFDSCAASAADLAAVNVGASSLDPDASGIIGGGQFGWLSGGGFAWGLEADFDYMGRNQTSSAVVPYAGPAFCGAACGPALLSESINRDWLATVRARFGMNGAGGYWYLTGGLAVGDQTYTATYFDSGVAAGPPVVSYASTFGISDTRFGWTAGAGWEFGFGGNWSLKAEYLYVDLGGPAAIGGSLFPTNTTFGAVFADPTLASTASYTQHVGRVGLNLHF